MFYGLGADGTVGANKNSIKIIGEETDLHVQGYFVYDSKKAGATTVSHLRTSPRPIRSAYLISKARFVACHQFEFLERVDVLEHAVDGAVFLLNAPYAADGLGSAAERGAGAADRQAHSLLHDRCVRGGAPDRHGRPDQHDHADLLLRDLRRPAARAGDRTDQARDRKDLQQARRRGREAQLRGGRRDARPLAGGAGPVGVTATHGRPPLVSALAPDFVQRMTAVLLAGKGDLLPVSAFPVDGTWPVGTAKWEKRNLALEIPCGMRRICIQCNQCVLVCPHAAIRAKVYDDGRAPARRRRSSPCPTRGSSSRAGVHDSGGARGLHGLQPVRERLPGQGSNQPAAQGDRHAPAGAAPRRRARQLRVLLDLPDTARVDLPKVDHKTSQFLEPLFEYSGACAGCGETPIKLLTQLFGDRALVANATGCSSIYGGNLPTTPFTTNHDGRGPAWSNSLFEDNAEFGLGMRLGVDTRTRARAGGIHGRSDRRAPHGELLGADQSTEAGIPQRERVRALRQVLAPLATAEARRLEALADYLVKKSIWLVGATGGPTTSGTAASTTSWPASAT